jgi:hypothetical protein
MKLAEREFSFDGLVVSSEQTAPRSAGIHVSQIIRHINAKVGPRRNEMSEENLNAYAIFGRIWEQYLADATFKAPRYERVGELEVDGIIGSPDAVDTVDWRIMEYKCWWRSSSRDVMEYRDVFWQIKAYCFMLGLVRAQLIVAFVCGDWKPPIPKVRAWDMVFTPQELRENWAMLKENSKELLDAKT